MKEGYERVYATVDLDEILYNLNSIAKKAQAPLGICAVLKADGYGHGAAEIASVLEPEASVWGYAVATPDEGVSLRKNGAKKPILLLGYAMENRLELLIENEIRIPLFEADMAERISETAVRLGKTARCHIKVDTGMSRIGLFPDEEGLEIVKKASMLPGLELEGMFTHLATADMIENAPAYAQLDRFRAFREVLRAEGIEIPVCHFANSAASMLFDCSDSAICRLGISLYGLFPSDEPDWSATPIHPVLSLYSQVTYVKKLPENTAIGYGGTYKTTEERIIATVSAGYADGYPRGLSNRASVLIRGKRCPIVGRVCMDQFMVDVTALGDGEGRVRRGDRVTLIGKDGEERITMEELGEISGRFNYELACDLTKRVPHVFLQNGAEISSRDYF